MRLAIVPVLAGLLTACGGGGGGAPAPPPPSSYSVTTSAQTGGTIAPAGATVAAGSTASFAITPASGYAVSSVSGCGGALSGNAYTTASIASDCTITATFAALDFHVAVRGNALGGLALENNGAERIDVNGDGRFTFSTGIHVGAAYLVRVAQQPVTHVCRVTNGDGIVSTASVAVDVRCVNRVVAVSPLTLRTAVDSNGHFQQTLYFRSRTIDLHQLRVRVADGVPEEVAPAWSLGPFPTTFIFSSDGSRAFADDGLGSVAAATVREADGAIVPAWTAPFGNYTPLLPVTLVPVRPSQDGRLIYRNVSLVVNGLRYDDLWVGAVDDVGVRLLAGSPFALATDGSGPTLDPSGRYLARMLRSQGRLEVYRAFSPSTLAPEIVHVATPLLSGASGSMFTESFPGSYLYESQQVTATTLGELRPRIALHAFRDDGSLMPMTGPIEGDLTDGAVAAAVCPGATLTTRASFLSPLPPGAVSASRYLLQQQYTSCFGTPLVGLADSRVLGVHLLRVASGHASLTRLPLDVRPEWSDLGAGGFAHPSKPWLYLGSKRSDRVYGYAVDEATGTVEALPGSPYAVEAAPAPGGVTTPALIVDPTERFLFLAHNAIPGLPSVYAASFAIDSATGALTHVGTFVP
jgi:hypothetical protein